MRRKRSLLVVGFLFACLSTSGTTAAGGGQNPRSRPRDLSFAEKLNLTVQEFDTGGSSMTEVALHLAYKYKLPMAIEYADHNALHKPLFLKLKNHSLAQVILAVVATLSHYDVDLSQGLVDIYSPDARRDKSNPLNTEIRRYDASSLDTRFAGAELFCDLIRQLRPHSGCGGSVAGGQWGNLKINLHLENKPVYEVLNAIIAQNGQALWIPVAQPAQDSSITRDFWYIYPLDPPFERSAIEQLQMLVPSQGRDPDHE